MSIISICDGMISWNILYTNSLSTHYRMRYYIIATGICCLECGRMRWPAQINSSNLWVVMPGSAQSHSPCYLGDQAVLEIEPGALACKVCVLALQAKHMFQSFELSLSPCLPFLTPNTNKLKMDQLLPIFTANEDSKETCLVHFCFLYTLVKVSGVVNTCSTLRVHGGPDLASWDLFSPLRFSSGMLVFKFLSLLISKMLLVRAGEVLGLCVSHKLSESS